MTLGSRVKEARKAINMSQAKLAEMAGISIVSMSKIERDITTRPDCIMELSQILNRSVAYLQFGEEDNGAYYNLNDAEASLDEINQNQGVLRIQLRKRDAAIVMSVDHYKDLIKMKASYAELIERIKQKEVSEEADEFEALYHRLTSSNTRKAADVLFSAPADSLAKTYQPGKTESQ